MTGPVLVTGAAGFVGSHLLQALGDDEPREIVAWRRPGHGAATAPNGIRWMEVDLLDREQVERAVATVKPSAVYHMAGAAHLAQSWQRVRETYEGNVRVTHYLLDALTGLPEKPRVLLPCTAHVYAPQPRPIREDDELRPNNPYATSKLAVEMLGEKAWIENRLPVVIARAFNHIGPRQDPSYVAPSIARQIALIEQGRLEPVLTMGSLSPRRDVTDVRDTVRAYLALMAQGRPGIRYNVASGRALAIGDLVHAFAAAAHRDVRVIEDPARFRPNDPPLLVGDNSRLAADTGWQLTIPLEKTIHDLLDYWRGRVKAEA
jgi:GDP-4-dehydro-6-deoxy-D-mannose reductase